MERLISRLLQAAMRIAVVLMILAFIAFGMVGVYRVSKLSWRAGVVVEPLGLQFLPVV
jgi:TRAP-type C4-dicarboxylate transport system permease small subunit